MTFDAGISYNGTPYTSPSLVRAALSPDGDPSDLSTAAGLDDTTLNGPCQDATNEIDARLASRYNVPFTGEPPAIITSIASDIAAYLATLIYRKGQPVDATDPVALRYARAEKILLDISTGVAALLVAADSAPAGEVVISNPVAAPLFGPSDYGLWPTPSSGRLSPDRWGYDRWYG